MGLLLSAKGQHVFASTIFAFLVVLTGTLVSGCFLSREPDTQSTNRKGEDWVKLTQTRHSETFVNQFVIWCRQKSILSANKFLKHINAKVVGFFSSLDYKWPLLLF